MRELGGYRLIRQIGSGGMGTVWEAIDADGRRVALKLVHPHIAEDPENRKRLEREVRLLHRVQGEGVAQVLDAEVEGDDVFVVTELIDGPTLEADVRERGPFAPAELAALARDLATALDDIHAAGVIHRDLKPSNVMISADGPVIIDFGIAQVVDETRLTQVGLVTGTPGYLDPEVMEGGNPTVAGDWWAWAAVLVYAATGRHPFGTGRNEVIFHRLNSGDVDVEGIASDTAAALRAALCRSSADRLSHVDVLRVLEGDLGGEDLTAILGRSEAPGGGGAVVPPRMPPVIAPGSGPARDGHTRRMPVAPPATRAVTPPASPHGAVTPPPRPVLPTAPRPVAPPTLGLPPAETDRTDVPGPVFPPTEPGPFDAAVSPSEPVIGGLPEPGRHPVFFLSVALLLAATATIAPAIAVGLLFVLLVIGATSGFMWWKSNDLVRRRGYGSGNSWRAGISLPLQILKALSVSTVSIVVAALVGVVAAGGVVLALGLSHAPSATLRATLAGAMFLTTIVAWSMGSSEVVRHGSRALIDAIFPFTGLRTMFALLVLAVAVVIGTMVVADVNLPMDWWPAPHPMHWWPVTSNPLL